MQQYLWIGREGNVAEWPARSPDHNPCDFYLWGTCKECILHNGAPATADECWELVQEWAAQVPADEIHRATHQVGRRAQLCIRERGLWFEQCLKQPLANDGGGDNNENGNGNNQIEAQNGQDMDQNEDFDNEENEEDEEFEPADDPNDREWDPDVDG